jgi:hypothetical protein
VTFQTGTRDFLSCFEFTSDDIGMIHVHRLLGQVVCRIGGGLIGAGKEVDDWDEYYNDDSE